MLRGGRLHARDSYLEVPGYPASSPPGWQQQHCLDLAATRVVASRLQSGVFDGKYATPARSCTNGRPQGAGATHVRSILPCSGAAIETAPSWSGAEHLPRTTVSSKAGAAS